MENASKALIMAGGVLIGVAILSLALYLFATFSGSSDKMHKQIEDGKLIQFNNQFTSYQVKDCTIYDVLSVVYCADEYNEKNFLSDSTSDQYIKVYIGTVLVNGLQSDGKKDANHLVESKIDLDAYGYISSAGVFNQYELKKYSAATNINPLTGRVNEIIFTPK